MRVAVVYESLFGNTRAVAEAVAEGMQERDPAATVTVTAAARADDVAGADLLVVGAPTHFFRLPTPRSRGMWLRPRDVESGRTRTGAAVEPDAATAGIRGWLDALPCRPGAGLAATFDTRLHRPLTGSAGRRLAHALRRHGFRVVAHPESFTVSGMEGPLRPDELGHARAWGAALLDRVRADQRTGRREAGDTR